MQINCHKKHGRYNIKMVYIHLQNCEKTAVSREF